tara:strand:+ start:47 stop:247 length:201 start_codon:yes stop_codon:yes gene_type:complete
MEAGRRPFSLKHNGYGILMKTPKKLKDKKIFLFKKNSRWSQKPKTNLLNNPIGIDSNTISQALFFI